MNPPPKTKRPAGTVTTLSKKLKLSKRRTQTLLTMGMPDEPTAAIQWRQQRQIGGDTVEELRRERIQLVQSQRAAIDLANDVRRGLLVPAGEVEEHMSAIGFVMKSMLHRLANDAPPSLEGLAAAAIGEKLREFADKILDEFERELEPRIHFNQP